jgi:outer membrane protein assembly factor BamB
MLMNKFKLLSKAGFVFVATLCLTACSSNDDEDMANLVAELVDISPAFEPEVLWDESIGYGVSDVFSRLKPVIAYDKVFSASRDGDLTALDIKTGDELWSIDLSDVHNERGFFDNVRSAKLAGGVTTGLNKVFVGNENGDVYAVNADDGSLAWQAKIKGEVISKPAFDSGILVVNSVSGLIQAHNAETGEILWAAEQSVPALTLRGISAPTIASGGVFIGSAKGNISVYILETGQQAWAVDIGEASGNTELERVVDIDAAAIVFGEHLYAVSSRGNVAAIEVKSGQLVWKRQYSSYRSLAIDGNSLFLTTNRGVVYALNRNDGLELWSSTALTNRQVTGPVVFEDYIVVGDFDGYLHWLDQETGEILARHHVDGSGIYVTPTVQGGILYSQARNGQLEAIKIPEKIKAQL